MISLKTIIRKNKGGLRIASGIFAMSIASLSTPGLAQNAAGQQLPSSVVQQQIPQTFPSDEAGAQEPPVSILGDQSKSIPSSGQPGGPAINAPRQPETRNLVPSTPMGREARGEQEAPAVPIEAEQRSQGVNPDTETTALPDILEKYTATATNNNTTGGDALPMLDDATKMQLQAEALTSGASGVSENASLAAPAKTDAQLQEEIRTEAFDAAITGVFPLEPAQLRNLLERYDETQEAVETPVYDTPRPEISVQNISLDPGVMPPVIKTAVGNVTTINMLDATGAPWPVQDVTWAGDYEVVEPEEGGHIVRITPMSHFARGNIVVRLLTLKTPLTMTLETGRDVVQYRVDARIPEYGPFANAPIMQGGKSSLVAGSSELTAVLDGGVIGGEMVKLEVSGVDGRTTAFMKGGITYVRTPLTLLSPAWQSSVSSADGMNVYALTNAPVLLLSDGGEFMRAVLTEKKDLLDE